MGKAILQRPVKALQTAFRPGDSNPARSGEAAAGRHEAEKEALCFHLLELCWSPGGLHDVETLSHAVPLVTVIKNYAVLAMLGDYSLHAMSVKP